MKSTLGGVQPRLSKQLIFKIDFVYPAAENLTWKNCEIIKEVECWAGRLNISEVSIGIFYKLFTLVNYTYFYLSEPRVLHNDSAGGSVMKWREK